MEELKLSTCCFFGHRKINETDELKSNLYATIEKLIIKEKVDTFLFGSKSQFNDLCHTAVTKLKEKYPHIKRVYVRAEFPHIDESYRKYLFESYEDTYYPDKMLYSGKAAYIERNRVMIERSMYCICYYDENYTPPRKNRTQALPDYLPKSGTRMAFDYARKKNLTIYNLF